MSNGSLRIVPRIATVYFLALDIVKSNRMARPARYLISLCRETRGEHDETFGSFLSYVNMET